MHPNWGDAPAWAACALSIVAVIVAARGQRKSNAAAERSALAAERALAIQQQQAAAAAAAAAPKVEFVVERGVGDQYLLRNVGEVAAMGVEVDVTHFAITRGCPLGASIGPHAAVKMLLKGAAGKPLPSELWVKWSGQGTPVAVALPPR